MAKRPVDPKMKCETVGMITAENFALDSQEVRKDIQMQAPQMNALFTSTEDEDNVIEDILDRQNNWRTTVRTLSWCKRFYANIKKRINQKSLASTKRNLRNRTDHSDQTETPTRVPQESIETKKSIMKSFIYIQKKLKRPKNNYSAMPKKQNLWKKLNYQVQDKRFKRTQASRP